MNGDVLFTRAASGADAIERLILETRHTVDAALYRFTNPRLATVLEEAARRGVRVRLVLDRNKYKEAQASQELLRVGRITLRLLSGPKGRDSKMHHKFAILDRRTVTTGSYNWTLESEDENYDNLLILREPEQVEAYVGEFEALWRDAWEVPRP